MTERPAPRAAADRGSITPLLIGMALVLFLFGLAVAVVGSAFLTRQNLQNLCDGAATVAGNITRPDLGAGQDTNRLDSAVAAYVAGHGGDIGVSSVIMTGTSVSVRCEQTTALSAAGLFDLPAHHTYRVEAFSTPALLG